MGDVGNVACFPWGLVPRSGDFVSALGQVLTYKQCHSSKLNLVMVDVKC